MKPIVLSLILSSWFFAGCYQTAKPNRVTSTELPRRIACVGDSITFGAGVEGRETNHYPAVLGQLLGRNYLCKNFGVSGATLLRKGDKPYYVQRAYREAMEFLPEIVIIKLGTNDTKPQNWKYGEDFLEDCRRLVRDFRALPSKPKIYLCLPVPIYQDRWGIRSEILNNQVIPVIRKVARQERAEVIDLFSALQNQPQMFPDSIHPNAAGARLMAETVAARLTRK